jgi:hypothetical protein
MIQRQGQECLAQQDTVFDRRLLRLISRKELPVLEGFKTLLSVLSLADNSQNDARFGINLLRRSNQSHPDLVTYALIGVTERRWLRTVRYS